MPKIKKHPIAYKNDLNAINLNGLSETQMNLLFLLSGYKLLVFGLIIVYIVILYYLCDVLKQHFINGTSQFRFT